MSATKVDEKWFALNLEKVFKSLQKSSKVWLGDEAAGMQ